MNNFFKPKDAISRGAIYEYFHGRNVKMQLFVICAGIALILASFFAAPESTSKKDSKYYDDYLDAKEEYEDAKDNLEDFKHGWYNGKMTEEELEEEVEKTKKQFEKMEKKVEPSNPGPVFVIIGVIVILGGVGWMLVKKLTYDSKGEVEVDKDLSAQMEKAKVRALEKLNLVSEQVDMVDPVCLHGVCDQTINKTNARAVVAGNIKRTIAKFLPNLLYLVISIVLLAITSASVVGIILWIIVTGFFGFLMYMNYEVNRVSHKDMELLRKFDPEWRRVVNNNEEVRFSLPEITVYMFGETQLYVYYQKYDIVTGDVFGEGMNEYFYRDIVGITSAQETMRLSRLVRWFFIFKKRKYFSEVLETITLYSSGCSHHTGYITKPGESILDTKFLGMRNLIRNKKDELK